MNRPAYLLDIPEDVYHTATKMGEYVTSHRLAVFRRCPLEFHKREIYEIVDGDTKAFEMGRITHRAILEPQKFDAEYCVANGPINEKTGKPYGKETAKYATWAAEQGKPVVSKADYEILAKMREAVRMHKAAADILSAGFAEGTIRGEWKGQKVQARLDWYNPEENIIADLKTCADVDRFSFDIRDFGYVYQLAFYAKLVHMARGGKEMGLPDCYLIAVEKKEPYRVLVVHPFPLTIEDALNQKIGENGRRVDNLAMMEQLVECRRTDTWPTRTEDVIRF